MGKRGERSAGRTSRFSLTCRLLSRYLKKNGNRENSPVPNTAGFEPGVGGVSGKNHHHHRHRHAENSTLAKEESNAATNTKQKRKDQLTVFYGGKVVVFDNFPADTAKDLMLMASEDTAADPTATRDLMTPQRSRPKPTQANDSSGDCHRLHALGHGTPSMTDMPIARRNSLHRFLEKRKDRVGKAPYRVHGGSEVAKTEEDRPWLSLGRQTPEAGSTSRV